MRTEWKKEPSRTSREETSSSEKPQSWKCLEAVKVLKGSVIHVCTAPSSIVATSRHWGKKKNNNNTGLDGPLVWASLAILMFMCSSVWRRLKTLKGSLGNEFSHHIAVIKKKSNREILFPRREGKIRRGGISNTHLKNSGQTLQITGRESASHFDSQDTV